MYNKKKFNKINDKKILHKVKKQWVTISLALLMMIGGGAVATHVSASADTTNSRVPVTKLRVGHQTERNITSRAKTLHSNLLSRVAKRTNGNAVTVNHNSIRRINSVNKLGTNQSGRYNGQVYSRINVPFNRVKVNHKVALHSSINLKHDRVYGHLYKGTVVKVAKAFREFGRYNNYLRYEIHLDEKRNAFISGSKSLSSYVLPSRNYKYYQRKINRLIRKSHSKRAKKIRTTLSKLNRKRNFNYRKYADLYKSAFNVEQAVKHPVVINYKHINPRNTKVPVKASVTPVTSSSANVNFGTNAPASSSVMSSSAIPAVSSVTSRSSNFRSSASAPAVPMSSSATILPASSSISVVPISSISADSSTVPNSSMTAPSSAINSDSTSDPISTSSSSDSVNNPSATSSSSDNGSDVTPKPDATHKYLVPNDKNQNIMLSSDGINNVETHNINYRQGFSNVYSNANASGTPLVHIDNNKKLLGYNLSQVSDDNGLSDTWVFSDELNSDKDAKSTEGDYYNFSNVLWNGYGTDAAHKYLIPDESNKNITLGNINSDGNYSDYNYSDLGAPLFATVIGTKNVQGYNFDRIKINNSDLDDDQNVWVLSDELNNSPKLQNNDVKDWQNFLSAVQRRYYAPNEINQINNIKQRYNYLKQHENSDMNSTNLSQYKKNVIDWVNFYRSLYNLTPVTEDSAFDTKAQNGVEIDQDPEDMGWGDYAPSIAATGYVTDTDDADHDGTPGHRVSVLNPRASKVGAGAKYSNNGPTDSLYFDYGFNNPKYHDSEMAYPNAGVFPLDLVNQGKSDYWGYSFITNSNVPSDTPEYEVVTPTNLNVSVHDDTLNSNVAVKGVHAGNSEYGDDYSGAVFYSVDTNALKPNHQYTITITGQGIPNGKYTYTTKLFNLDND